MAAVTYTRVGKKGSYTFAAPDGKKVTNPALLAYFESLKIPPAYTDVRIFVLPGGAMPKILYIGLDAAGREQPHYSPEHIAAAERRKFAELLTFARQIPAITAAVVDEIKGAQPTLEKAIALILRLMMTCHFRIGNERFYDKYGSAGARNVRKKHLKFATGADGVPYVQMSFPGKKGVINTCHITDEILLRELRARAKDRDDEDMLFTYTGADADASPQAPTAIEVNNWLKRFDPSITSKQFRTYDANMMLLVYLCNAGDPTKKSAAARKAVMREAMIEIAGHLHNTPAIARKNYMHPGIIEMYLNAPLEFVTAFMEGRAPMRDRFVAFLS